MNLKEIFPATVTETENGLRLDQFLVQKLEGVSRARALKLIETRGIRINGKLSHQGSKRVHEKDSIDLDPADFNLNEKSRELVLKDLVTKRNFTGLSPKIIHEEKEFLVLSKPAGLAVHPGAGLDPDATLVAWAIAAGKIKADPESLLAWGDEILEELRPGIVHRLDQGTSGLMVMAKTPSAHAHLSLQFSEKRAYRIYTALVKGSFVSDEYRPGSQVSSLLRKTPCPLVLKRNENGILELVSYLERDPHHRTRFQVSKSPSSGKRADSSFWAGSAHPKYSWVEAKLGTGRTHQIRVHLSFLNFPVLGDTLYGGEKSDRIYLHAHHLRIENPTTREMLRFSDLWPEKDLQKFKELELSLPKSHFVL